MRERHAEWRVGSPRAHGSCFGLGILHTIGRSVAVPHHCGIESRKAVALRGGSFCPQLLVSVVGFAPLVQCSHECSL
jgi:hypothetical protein